jgi:hypothetical protein
LISLRWKFKFGCPRDRNRIKTKCFQPFLLKQRFGLASLSEFRKHPNHEMPVYRNVGDIHTLAPQTHGWRSSKKIQAAVTIAHGGLLFPPEIPHYSANIDLPAKPPSLFPKSSCSLRPSNYKGIRSAEFHSFSRFSRPGVRSCEGLASIAQ